MKDQKAKKTEEEEESKRQKEEKKNQGVKDLFSNIKAFDVEDI